MAAETDPKPAAEPRKRLLINTAYELLESDGLEGLTIRAVLARAGLARRAFYECFDGKDDLVLAVFEHTLHDAAVFFCSQTQAVDDPEARLRIVVFGIVLGQAGLNTGAKGEASNKRSAALSREHLRLAESRPEELQNALKPLLDLITAIVSAGSASGQFRPCDAAFKARLIYNLVSTTVHTELLAEENVPPDRAKRQHLAEGIWEFCRSAIVIVR